MAKERRKEGVSKEGRRKGRVDSVLWVERVKLAFSET